MRLREVACCRVHDQPLVDGFCKNCKTKPDSANIYIIQICADVNCGQRLKRVGDHYECPKCGRIYTA